MKHVKKSVLLWYSPQEMYTLVTAVREYPEFLPWCERAEVVAQHDDGVTARLHLSYMGLKQSFTTRNHHVDGKLVTLKFVDGPFSKLDGSWHFHPVPKTEGPAAKACKVDFGLHYAFSSGALEALVSPVFDGIANTFVESFVKRAEQVYGER